MVLRCRERPAGGPTHGLADARVGLGRDGRDGHGRFWTSPLVDAPSSAFTLKRGPHFVEIGRVSVEVGPASPHNRSKQINIGPRLLEAGRETTNRWSNYNLGHPYIR